ncbi:hypothetical protein [Brenneria roseae]|uniref:hypothetical protein n=1 Tax=Brenneria roseae TaxID=1509241 RepID=UPI00109D8A4A|nr:hypothetical protein [Brenneria roseae]
MSEPAIHTASLHQKDAAVKRSDKSKTSPKKEKCKALRKMLYGLQQREKPQESATQIELNVLASRKWDGIREKHSVLIFIAARLMAYRCV